MNRPIKGQGPMKGQGHCGVPFGLLSRWAKRGVLRPALHGMLLLVSLLAVPALTVAESQTPQFVSIRVGFGDRYKTGLWTPVEVVLQGGDEELTGDVSLTVPDGDGVPSRVTTPPEHPCKLSPGSATTVRLLCRFGRVRSKLTAAFTVDGRVVAQRTFESALHADGEHFLPGVESRKLIVCVGPAMLGIEEAGKLGGLDPEHRPAVTQVADPTLLPTQWCGYDGVDAVVIATSRPEIFASLTAQSDGVRALDEWVQRGGRLVLCVGSHGDQVLRADGPFSPFLPGRFDKMVSLPHAAALESYCGSRSSIMPPSGTSQATQVPRLNDVQGIVEAREADLPLVIRKAHGFGQVLFLAIDPDQAPIATWVDRPALMARLLDMPVGRMEESQTGTAIMHFGYNDLAGQLRSALDRFDGVRVAPFWLVAALIVGYLLLIGPGDYFLLRGLFGRMTWTWLTFPTIIVLVSIGGYVLAYRLKGDQVRLNQADLIDVDAVSGRVRGVAWLNLFSPRIESFNLAARPELPGGGPAADVRAWTTWLGLPGGGLGGMDPRAGEPSLWTEPYDFSPSLDAMLDVPIPVWATKSLTARWDAVTKEFPQAELSDDGQLVVGTLTNSLGVPLEQCLLAHGRFVYDLGTLAPGESVRLGALTKRSELKTLLTGRRVIIEAGDKYRRDSTPYDQSSTDAAYILRTMMFYDAAGGHQYTGLWNAYQNFVDMSALLNADRAILIAQGSSNKAAMIGGATLLRDGAPTEALQNQRVTFYRFVYPVKKSG